MSFIKAYRPIAFTEVLGQSNAVKWCEGQLKHRTFANGIFAGPTGTGKSTVAPIYARGILCTGTGAIRPCNECADCKSLLAGERHDGYREVDCAKDRDYSTIRDIVEAVSRGVVWQPRYVLFLDEAQRISHPAFDLFLKPLEHPDRPTTVILATSEPNKLPKTLRGGRTHEVIFQPISFEDSFNAACNVCRKEGIPFDVNAVELLVEASTGSHRKTLALLEQIFQSDGAIDLSAARRVLNLEAIEQTTEIVLAMLSGNLGGAIALLQRWQITPAEKADLIQRLLLFIFNNEILRLRFSDPLFASASDDEVLAISEKVAKQAQARSIAPHVYWRLIIKFWEPAPANSQASILARADRFTAMMMQND